MVLIHSQKVDSGKKAEPWKKSRVAEMAAAPPQVQAPLLSVLVRIQLYKGGWARSPSPHAFDDALQAGQIANDLLLSPGLSHSCAVSEFEWE